LFSPNVQQCSTHPDIREELLKLYYVGEYLVTGRLLGQGSWGSVYFGFNRTTGEAVSIKVMSYAKASEQTKRYLAQEVKIMKELQHSSVIKLYEATLNETGRSLYVVMEFCEYGNLDAFLRDIRPEMSEEAEVHFMREIAFGLEFLRSKGIVHRDLKLENILVTKDELGNYRLKLCDFTFAKSLAKSEMTNTVCGSPLYMAPEVLNAQPYTEQADLWSVGVIMFQILFDQYPYTADSSVQLAQIIAKNDLEFPTKSVISPHAMDLLKRLLEKDPFKRISWDDFFHHPFLNMAAHKSALDEIIHKLRDPKEGIIAFTKSEDDIFTGKDLLDWMNVKMEIEAGSANELALIRRLEQCEDGIVIVKSVTPRKPEKSKSDLRNVSAFNMNTVYAQVLSDAFKSLEGYTFKLRVPKATWTTFTTPEGTTKKTLKTATLGQIIRIYSHEPTDKATIREFALAHSQFVSTIKVLKALEVVIFNEDSKPGTPKGGENKDTEVITARMRAVNILDELLSSRINDLKFNEDFKKGIRRLIKTLDNKPTTKPFADHLEAKINNLMREPAPDMALAPKPEKMKKSSGSFSLTDFSSLEIARQLCLIDQDTFSGIPMEELVKAKRTITAKRSPCPKLFAATAFQNRLSLWFAWSILREQKTKRHVKDITFLIGVAKNLIELRNLNSV